MNFFEFTFKKLWGVIVLEVIFYFLYKLFQPACEISMGASCRPSIFQHIIVALMILMLIYLIILLIIRLIHNTKK